MESRDNSHPKRIPGGGTKQTLNRDIALLSGDIASVLATLETMKVDFEQNSSAKQVATDVPQGGVKKKRVRKRNRKRSVDSQSDNLSVDTVAENAAFRKELLSEENILILQLLSMDSREREQYLTHIALERGVLLFSPRGNQSNITVNPILYNFLKSNRQNGHYAKMQRFLEAGVPSGRQNRQVPSEGRRGTQEGQKEKKKKKQKKKTVPELSDIEELYVKLIEEATKDKPFTQDLSAGLVAFADEFVKQKRGIVCEGEIRVSTTNYNHAFMLNPTGGKDIIFRSSILRRHALPGDRVLAFVFKATVQKLDTKADTSLEDNEEEVDEKDKPDSVDGAAAAVPEIEERDVGVVLDILEEGHTRLVVGTFLHPLNKRNLLSPRDARLPRVLIDKFDIIRTMTKNPKPLKVYTVNKYIFLARITESRFDGVSGELLKIVGQVGELVSENRAILMANDLNPEPYPEAILAALPDFTVTPKDFEGREDLRSNTCIFTIDPATARDLDDAVSCVKIDEEIYEIGVHIADVAHFIPENGPLDEILKKKTTSIYMVDTVYHMLPLPMCLGLSLLPGKDRLAFSVFWRMDSNGNILKERIAKTVINSCTQLAYAHAQEIIDNPDKEFTPNEFPTIHSQNYALVNVIESVRVLHKLSRKLRAKRFAGGAVKLDQPKISFSLDPQTGEPKEFHTDIQRESNQLIEEYMLLANMTVARWTHQRFPGKAVLRCHNEPDKHQFEKLASDFKALGVPFDLSSTPAISESLEKAIEANKDVEAAKTILTCMLTKPMTRARYFCSGITESEEEFRHYLLSIPIYTHFTSPIRRYPDILVHRLLAAAECGAPEPQLQVDAIEKIANMCNVQKYNAKLAGNDSINLYFNKYVETAKVITMRAAVFKIGARYADVILIETGHHVKANFGAAIGTILENVTPRTVNITHSGNKSTITLGVFSECKVAVSLKKDKLVAKLVWPSDLTAPKNVPSQKK